MELEFTDKTITLRRIQDRDIPVLKEIYWSTRTQEMERVPHWTPLMKKEFLEQQFHAQHTYYQNNYKDADFWLILKNKKIAGRLYVSATSEGESLRIIDITLLPEFRNTGTGTAILKELLQRSEKSGLMVSIHVEAFNPAKQLYERLGFKKISETDGIYHLMEWKHTI